MRIRGLEDWRTQGLKGSQSLLNLLLEDILLEDNLGALTLTCCSCMSPNYNDNYNPNYNPSCHPNYDTIPTTLEDIPPTSIQDLHLTIP